MSILPPQAPEKKVMFPHLGSEGETVHKVVTGERWTIFFMSQIAVRGTLGGRILLYLWNAPYEKLASDEVSLSLMEVHLQLPRRWR